jgi:hypothetical protein
MPHRSGRASVPTLDLPCGLLPGSASRLSAPLGLGPDCGGGCRSRERSPSKSGTRRDQTDQLAVEQDIVIERDGDRAQLEEPDGPVLAKICHMRYASQAAKTSPSLPIRQRAEAQSSPRRDTYVGETAWTGAYAGWQCLSLAEGPYLGSDAETGWGSLGVRASAEPIRC